jgi:ethanolamine phosphate phosphodiesterase
LIEFEKIFNQPSIITVKNITFFKVNAIAYIRSFPTQIEEVGNLKVVVSHYPVTDRFGFGNQVMNGIHPNVFFCAHDHESKYVRQNKDLSQRVNHVLDYGANVLDVEFEEEAIYEIYVPTCSYRMGTDKIGFGAAVIEDNNQRMKYTVFWSPTRFPYLMFYLGIAIFLCLYFIIFCAARLFHRYPRITKQTVDKQPLLQRM